MAVILTRTITQTEFGTYRQVIMVFSLVTSMLSLSIPQSMYYFLPKAEPSQRRGILVNAAAALFASALVCVSLLWFGAGFLANYVAKDSALAQLLQLYGFAAIGHLPMLLVAPALISQERVILAGVFTISEALLRTGTVVTFFALGYPTRVVLVAAAVVSLAVGIAGLLLLFGSTARGPLVVSSRVITEQLKYALPLAAAGMTGIVAQHIDKWIIMAFFTSAQFAVYSVGAMQVPIIPLVVTSVTQAMMPTIVRLGEQQQLEKALAIWHEGIRKCALILFPAFIFLLLTSRDIIVFLFQREYVAAVGPFVVYLVMLPLQVAVYGAVLRATGHTRPILIGAIVSLGINIVMSISLILFFQDTPVAFIAPALATVIAKGCTIGYLLFQICRVTGMPIRSVFPWSDTARIMLSAALCGLIAAPIHLIDLPEIGRIALVLVLYAPVFMVFVWFRGILRRDEKELVKSVLRRGSALLSGESARRSL